MLRIPRLPGPANRLAPLAALGLLALLPTGAGAHFLWLKADPAPAPGRPALVQVFLNEEPEVGGPEFLRYVDGVRPTTSGVPLAVSTGPDSVRADWSGPLPLLVDAERDLGLKTKGETTYRLSYTARLQAEPVAATLAERGDKLRVRVVRDGDAPAVVQVLLAGKPAPGAKIRTYPRDAEGTELTADDHGRAVVPGAAEGTTPLWANVVDPTPGTLDGKPFAETRYYATLNYPAKGPTPATARATDPAARPATAFATMPDPAVNSFAGAVLGDWLYVYSGHTGATHEYSTATTSKQFRRLSLRDRTTWEDLPMGRDVQGAALVGDGRYLYRTGGMTAHNAPGQPSDLTSCADFARFDPESKVWTDLPPLPVPRSTHDSAVVGRTVYVAGGWTMRGKEKSVYLADAAGFDLDHPEAGWQTFPQPFRRRALAVAEAGGKLYVLGGLDDRFQITRRVDVYDPATGAWTLGPELPDASGRDGFAASACAVDGRLYLNGLSGIINRLDDTPTGAAWRAVGAWALPRNTHRLLVAPDRRLLAVGGNYQGDQTPVIEALTLP